MIPDSAAYNRKMNERPSRLRRRRAILSATRTLCQRGGYEAMTMEAIADEAKITKPTLYAYFSNKEELTVEAFVEALQAHVHCLRELAESLPAEARLNQLLRAILEERLDPKRDALVLPGPTISAHPQFQKELRTLVELCVGLLRDAQTHGEANSRLNPEVAVRAYLALLTAPLERDRAGFETLHTILVNGLKPA
jgi:AcrR family transcriptional regulator